VTAVVRSYADGVEFGRGLSAPEVSEIDASHDESDHTPIELRDERYPDVRLVQGLSEFCAEVLRTIACGGFAMARIGMRSRASGPKLAGDDWL
jgi:hypothetical protein